MTTPRRWTPSDPITAERLNTSQAEASRPRRDIVLGNGSSMVNEQLGNQSANMRSPLVKLVVALEDFAIPETPTDVPGMVDDVPSGLVRELRLDRKSSTHANSKLERPFLAYDALSGLSGKMCSSITENDYDIDYEDQSQSVSGSDVPVQGRVACDVFYVMFNLDSKRWEVLSVEPSGGGETIWFTIIDVHCPDDYDTEWYLIVSPLWYTGNCGKVPPGQKSDGYWHFYSLCGFDIDQVDSDLIGTIGHGTYFFPYDSEPCEPRWLISDLCGIPECS